MPSNSPRLADLHAQVSCLARDVFAVWLETPETLAAYTDVSLALMALHDAANSLKEAA